MIALIIIGVLLLIIIAVLFLPVSILISFKEDLYLKVNFSLICIFKLKQDEVEEKPTAEREAEPKEKTPKKENIAVSRFKALKKKYGFTGAVREILKFVYDLLPHIRSLLKHIKFKRITLNINVAEDDAAKTAINYGKICAAVYPTLAALDTFSNVKYKAIDIRSDFEGKKSELSFGAIISTRIFFLLLTLIKVFKEYKKFTVRTEQNERK